MNWLRRNADVLEAIGALATALIAAVALIGVKLQIDAAADTAHAQNARELYRTHLTLSIAHPHLAEPAKCLPFDDKHSVAYGAYFEHFLYTAEQVMQMDPTWVGTFRGALESHTDAICPEDDWSGYTSDVRKIIADARLAHCQTYVMCTP